MTTQTAPATYVARVGSLITHPDFTGVREVLDVRPCCAGVEGVTPHVAYIVSDAPWGTTWVCSQQAAVAS